MVRTFTEPRSTPEDKKRCMEPSDRHRWKDFVLSVDHICHQGSNLSHCRQLSQPPSSIHTVPILQCNNGLGTICAQMAIQGREFSPTHYKSARSAYTCVANRVVRKTCRCRKAGLYCSPMCSHYNGQTCSNMHALVVSHDSDDDS